LSRLPTTLPEALIEAESRNASLGARLAAYRDSTRRIRPDIAKAYDDLVARLDMLDNGAIGPQIGEPLPEFNLPDENGRLVSLSSLLRSGPAVISLNRGHWCPYCKLELRSLATAHDRIKEVGASIVSIMPDVAEYTGGYSRANELPFPLLSDVDLGYSLSLGLIFWIGADVQRLYEEAGLDLGKYHRGSGYFLPIAAKFVVGQDGLVKARQVNVEFRQRMEPDAVVATLRALQAA
jgi:peroxiredoxin